ncbi:B3 domain-containing protein Os04g0386900-like isoform X2 [Salvia miltiorrhiza]|nr:B3 domain-containing protein Os04g0386900-like isoform X2 [Salvia miltiorrhiza]
MNEGNTGGGVISSSAEVDGLRCLSGDKPFFDVILSKSHIDPPHCLRVPTHILPSLPSVAVPLVLRHGDKEWRTLYNGGCRRPRIEYAGWKSFVVDNNLKVGDACVFEVLESSTEILRLRVLILRNTMYLPPQLLPSDGRTPETAIEIP